MKHAIRNRRIFARAGISQPQSWERIETAEAVFMNNLHLSISQPQSWERIETMIIRSIGTSTKSISQPQSWERIETAGLL